MSDVLEIGFDELEELYAEAEQLLEQATSYAQIGKFSFYNTAHIWDKENSWRECDVETYRKHPTGFGYMKHIQLHVCVDTQEFNPELGFSYERRIQVAEGNWKRKNEETGEQEVILSNWFGVWTLSVKNVLGAKFEGMSQALKYLDGKYVKCLDVLQQPTKRQPEPEYNTVKLVAVYESRSAALKDYEAITGKTVSEATTDQQINNVPPGYESRGQFEETVRALRNDDGLNNSEIASALSSNEHRISVRDVLGVE